MNAKEQAIVRHNLEGTALHAFEMGYNMGVAVKTAEIQKKFTLYGTTGCGGCETGIVAMFVKSKLCFACLHRGGK